ncbi:MAG: hypothetical protein F4Y44_03785 [Chloroflexi bacterium]|nr:hypothetical protein [Chloroflexota bacterium]
MELVKEQIASGLRSLGVGLIQTIPTFLIVVWLLAATVGWGITDLLGWIAASQPISPLWELILGA